MTARGAFLAPVLVPVATCFVNLPRAFIQTFLGGPDTRNGATILELSWETLDGYVQRVCVGWVGGITRESEIRSDTFEIPAEFARCVGLQEHLARSPQAFIGVHVVDLLPVARDVNVEPCTEDDWELIQLHAGLMETEFLRQICVVNDRQVHPIWVQQNIVIRIRVSLPVGMEFARLRPESEVIVAPKERKPLNTSTTLDPEFYYGASPELSVQQTGTDAIVSQDEVWIHPETLATIEGIDGAQGKTVVAAVWNAAHTKKQSAQVSSDESATKETTFCVAELEFQTDPAEEELAAQLEDIPIGALEKYAVVDGAISVEVTIASSAEQQQLHLLQILSAERTDNYDRSILRMGRDAPAYKKAYDAVRPTLMRDDSAARVILGVQAPGSVLLHGDRGSGKSTVLRALADHLQVDTQSLASLVHLECRNLRGLKMDMVKTRLSEAFQEAQTFAPSIIVLDNVDALVPEENETAGPANEQSRRIAEHLITLMQHIRGRMWKTTLELNSSIKREAQQLQKDSDAVVDQAAAVRALVEVAGSAMLRKSVAVLAGARSEASVHKSLRCCGLFDQSIQVMAPNAEQRESIIHNLLRLKLQARASVIKLDPAIDFGLLASLTEGYSLRDLGNAADRALHQTFLRHARGPNGDGKKMIQADFTQALEGFQPTALVGVDLFKSSVQWDDVGGLSSVRNVLKDTLELPTRYGKLYDQTPIKLPAGMLLYGPPGCGKTLLASAVASECGLNFISVKGPEVLNKYIGASEQAIRDLFARAASAAPSVLFLDEFDSIAPRRGADNTGVTDRLVNQLLTFLDGVESRKGVYVLAATSRPDMIDPALLRPGRLDKSLYCGFPNEVDRLDILRAVARKMELSDEAHEYLQEIAAAPKSTQFSGADLQALVYSAQLELVHEKLGENPNNSNVIEKRHFEAAFLGAKSSTSQSARREFDVMYANFSKARNTEFSVAAADVSADANGLKTHIQHQRTALA
ncbi:hypothetical protein Poli38472_009802 [Pythium oligandrum]|uniref:Peroxisomal ATPase PEX1 n=1 Tax=Pythium oligandrum TaxID=41045 RepID=A0A8K1FIP8_PYTOL|nr:hypothetical protein Poli38472_009802 [Pythium oligandrum]|eukprot:TMW62309.1 hypothetical protein Poli38472_009802 [Pythium oligandrum]